MIDKLKIVKEYYYCEYYYYIDVKNRNVRKKKLIYENYFSRKNVVFFLVFLIWRKEYCYENSIWKLEIRPKSKIFQTLSQSFLAELHKFPLLRHLRERCGLFASMVDHDLCWFSKRCKKKKTRRSLYFFKKKKKVSRFSNKFIDHFDLSLDENFFETIRVKRDEGER